MSVDAVQKDLNERFAYARDKGERWKILRGKGPVQGDCEDYSLTLIWLYEARSILRFWFSQLILRYVMWHCLSPGGEGHAIVWCRGRGWTDNIQRKMVTRKDLIAAGYKLKYPMPVPLVAMKFLLRPLLSRL